MPVKEAICTGYVPNFQAFLRHPRDVNEPVELDGPSALGHAVKDRHLASRLLASSADLNAGVEYDIPLSRAALIGGVEMIEMLLPHGDDVNRGQVLHWVLERREDTCEVLTMLLKRGASPNELEFEEKSSKSYFEHGADADKKDTSGETGRVMAAELGLDHILTIDDVTEEENHTKPTQTLGINLAFVGQAHKAGARVLIADLQLTPEAEQLVKTSSGKIAFTQCDVSNWSNLKSLPSEVTKAFGPDAVADIWIAGAGVFEPKWSSWLGDTEEAHYKQISINTEHPMKLTRIAMRSCLGANKPGVCLIVASGAGITGAYGCPVYCASKHACVGFTKSMAQADRDEGFKVVCILPGMVSTPLWTGQEAQDVHKQFSFTENVCITAEEVAEGMMEMVTQGKYGGGSLMEIRKGDLRNVLESREAYRVDEGSSPEMKAWVDECYRPIREVFKKERGVKKSGANGVH
ncbi:hypothetical protein LTR62_005524 [Meristemomyces frigidus]|uniref:Uncharacterized protein n=1 Tax=Meristemomyces frigidus TaxID=1508187 RepID=A0AAN7TGT3_9PEZI|nr:hypothetical protein LTR62_005524 [Meristemomyces frigidus]